MKIGIFSVRKIGYILLILSIISFLFYFYPENKLFWKVINAFYANICCEFLSLSISILLIDYLYEKQTKYENKKRLIRELGSEDRGFTSRALKEIKELNYHIDGSLINADLSKADLSNLDFSESNLTNVNFCGAMLTGAVFKHTNLKNAKFNDATLINTHFENSTFDKTEMKNCKISDSFFNNAQISISDFMNSSLISNEFIETKITDCKFESSNFSFANFTRTKFILCNLYKANLESSNMRNATFERCDMKEIQNWRGIADRTGTTFTGCTNEPHDFN